ncbi:TetR/AcrR family transcriptional regulator [Frankia sp. CNm7]|uniref:TetR/AcrR family transcriptional regulator n=1 Tax=Frankia nepalensis TaxID=1836974 RepID=A0A937URS4_9ACTN|nr:TetR/AcrR family transcriptional regulator [Frankia nepalensis]MBL7514605.1 TetR/AcrR family transcriptional regulator [Frankia nepalensis]MBL7524309.1 TetR/AcrR family transcriptional regulator [Frankia nepalensis]MBL7631682.1 TetR/AcrR family transcriptional regulator [Frankia nepalensis]
MTARQPLDRRSRRSRAALETALLKLLAERDLAHISISDVTKSAEVNRSTFYLHYRDMHDLAASVCTTMFDELIAASPVLMPDRSLDEHRRGREALTEVLAHVSERRQRPCTDIPPSTVITDPFTKDASTAARATIMWATSSGRPYRPAGM